MGAVKWGEAVIENRGAWRLNLWLLRMTNGLDGGGVRHVKRVMPPFFVVHDRETADTGGEALGERLQAVFDPLLAVLKSLAAQEAKNACPCVLLFCSFV
jgi:hypothetical protein